MVLVGPLAHLEERERADVTGAWVRDPRYGPQVKVSEAQPLRADGRGRAHRLPAPRASTSGRDAPPPCYAAHGAQRARARSTPTRSARSRTRGFRPRRAAEAARSWERCGSRAACTCCSRRTGSPTSRRGIHRHYGDRAHRVVAERPYELTSVFGVGFAIADPIARSGWACRRTRPARARAAVLHVLAEAERGGSTCLPEGALLAAAGELLGLESPDGELLREMAEAGDLELDEDADARRRAGRVDLPRRDRRAGARAGRARRTS